jgi:hypothetical protein
MPQGKTKVVSHLLNLTNRTFTDDDSSSSGPSHTSASGSTGTVSYGSTIAYGSNYPDWRTRILGGLNATTNMSGTIQRVLEAKEGFMHAELKQVPDAPNSTGFEIRKDTGFGYLGITAPLFHSNPSFPTISLVSATNRALARYNAKVSGVNRQFQGGVFFGELAEALHGIRHPAEALFKGIESYSNAATKLRRRYVKSKADFLALSKNRRRQVGRAFSGAATGLWLENSFHWVPLMYDIQGAVSALEHTFDAAPYQMVKASAYDEQQKTTDFSSWGTGRIYAGTVSTTAIRGASVKFYGIVRVGSRTTFRPDAKALGFDLRSFAPTVWELIPYSWAVDYFTNIGDIIYGASYGGSDVLWTAMGTKKFAKLSQISGLSSKPPVPTSGWHFTVLNGFMKPSECATETAQIARATYDGPYVPGLEYRVPGMSLKWLNLGSVFLQRSLAFL